MDCMVCRGACCETFSMEVQMVPFIRDAQNWLEVHAYKIDRSTEIPRLHFDCRCTKLTSDGLCSIWDERPMVCELFIAGGQRCLETVKERRTAEQYQLIRGDTDPLQIHGVSYNMRTITIHLHDDKSAWTEQYKENESGSFSSEDTDAGMWALNLVHRFNAGRRPGESERFIDSVKEEVRMAISKAEGIRMIDDLIKKFDDQELELRCELLEEMENRAATAGEAANEENEENEDVDDADEDLEDEELDEDETVE